MMLEEYHTFNDVEDQELRAWNRCAVAFNIAADESIELMREYLNQFNNAARTDISNMYKRIKNDGYEFTRAAVSRRFNALPHEDTENVAG
jgi:hypothetical protein